MQPHEIAHTLRALVDEAELYSQLFEDDEASDRAYGYLRGRITLLARQLDPDVVASHSVHPGPNCDAVFSFSGDRCTLPKYHPGYHA